MAYWINFHPPYFKMQQSLSSFSNCIITMGWKKICRIFLHIFLHLRFHMIFIKFWTILDWKSNYFEKCCKTIVHQYYSVTSEIETSSIQICIRMHHQKSFQPTFLTSRYIFSIFFETFCTSQFLGFLTFHF